MDALDRVGRQVQKKAARFVAATPHSLDGGSNRRCGTHGASTPCVNAHAESQDVGSASTGTECQALWTTMTALFVVSGLWHARDCPECLSWIPRHRRSGQPASETPMRAPCRDFFLPAPAIHELSGNPWKALRK